jgi:hypothetical protein
VLVELAFAIPIMTLIMVLIVDVGLIVREHQVIQNAAREGARFSAQPENQVIPTKPTATWDAIKWRVIEYAAGEGISLNLTDVETPTLPRTIQNYPIPISGGLTAYGSVVTVYYTRWMLIGAIPLLPTNSMTLAATSLFRNLY